MTGADCPNRTDFRGASNHCYDHISQVGVSKSACSSRRVRVAGGIRTRIFQLCRLIRRRSGHCYAVGSPTWIRTTIDRFKGGCPAVERSGNEMVGDQRIELRWRAFTEPAPRASPEIGGLHGNQTRLTPWTVELPRQMHRRPADRRVSRTGTCWRNRTSRQPGHNRPFCH